LILHVEHSLSCILSRVARAPHWSSSGMFTSGPKRPRFADADFGTQRAALAAASVVLFVPFAYIGYLLCLLVGLEGWVRIPITVSFGATLAIGAVRVAMGFAHGAGQVIARFVAPSGSTTPYEYSFSFQQSLAAKGDVAGALASYEDVLRQSPHQVEAHVQAAELYAKSGNAARAIELLRAVRVIPGVSETRCVYASNRLVDLYLAANDGRALVELRRLVDQHPGTDTGRRAREALGTIKARRGATLPASDAPVSSR